MRRAVDVGASLAVFSTQEPPGTTCTSLAGRKRKSEWKGVIAWSSPLGPRTDGAPLRAHPHGRSGRRHLGLPRPRLAPLSRRFRLRLRPLLVAGLAGGDGGEQHHHRPSEALSVPHAEHPRAQALEGAGTAKSMRRKRCTINMKNLGEGPHRAEIVRPAAVALELTRRRLELTWCLSHLTLDVERPSSPLA